MIIPTLRRSGPVADASQGGLGNDILDRLAAFETDLDFLKQALHADRIRRVVEAGHRLERRSAIANDADIGGDASASRRRQIGQRSQNAMLLPPLYGDLIWKVQPPWNL